MKHFFTNHLKLIAAVVVVLLAAYAVHYAVAMETPRLGVYNVSSGNIVSTVSMPGTVSSDNSVDLSFQEQGQISKVFVKDGDTVTAGETLASLNSSTQQTQVSQAQSNLAAARANYTSLVNGATSQDVAVSQAAVTSAQVALQNASSSLANTINQQNTAVKNANNTLLNTALTAVPGTGNTDSVVPTITGTYSGSAEGQYSISVYQTGGGLKFSVNGLETGGGNVQNQPVALGQSGLYIQFSGNPSPADTWTVSVPNMYASTYTANYNAYQTALQAQSVAVSAAQSQVSSAQSALAQAQAALALKQAAPTNSNIQEAQAQEAEAQAAVSSAELSVGNATIVAPFAGIIRDVIAQPGMVVSPNVPVLSIINNGVLKMDAYVSETDVAKVQSGAAVNVTLDAYGDGAQFPAQVTAVDTAETTFNGSPAYHVTLYFTQADSRIRSGMTGNVAITASEKDNVVAIPSRLVLDDGGTDFVLVPGSGQPARRQITTGLTGDNGMVEVTSGLNAGNTISDF